MWGVSTDTTILLLVALLNATTLWYARRTELNTNSMKDALVKSTKESSHAAGKEEGRVEGEIKAADLAKGKLGARKRS